MGYNQNNPLSRKSSPLNAKGDKCPESGCVQEAGGGKFKVISGITGKDWPSTFPSRDSAENAIKKYHAGGFSRKPSTKPSEKPYGGNKGDEKKSVRDYEGPSRKSSSPVKHTLTQGGDTFNHTHTKANEGTRSKGIKVTGKKTSASGGTSRKSSSPLNNAGNIYGGWKYSRELRDMPLTKDMTSRDN